MSQVKPQAIEYTDTGINLRPEIEATIPTERVKLQDGPFNGVSTLVPVGESRLLITQKRYDSWARPDIAFEYQRDSQPQFTFTGFREFNQAAELESRFSTVDDSDYRRGFLDGLHRAVSIVFMEQERERVGNACSYIIDRIREVAERRGYATNLLFQLHPDDQKDNKSE